jgi:hypothetical protein
MAIHTPTATAVRSTVPASPAAPGADLFCDLIDEFAFSLLGAGRSPAPSRPTPPSRHRDSALSPAA